MSQQVTLGNGGDVVSFLKSQHKQVKAAFAKVSEAEGKEREHAFRDLRRMMAVHETAEEEIVHPAVARALPNGKALVAQRLKEEKAAKAALVELEKLEVDSIAFEARLRTLQSDVLAHAESEEREEFDKLAAALDEDRLHRMRKVVELAESIAPTRPHPGIESAAANLLAGPFASMVDRVRDTLSTKP
jgi:hemerythrin superfamily protein